MDWLECKTTYHGLGCQGLGSRAESGAVRPTVLVSHRGGGSAPPSTWGSPLVLVVPATAGVMAAVARRVSGDCPRLSHFWGIVRGGPADAARARGRGSEAQQGGHRRSLRMLDRRGTSARSRPPFGSAAAWPRTTQLVNRSAHPTVQVVEVWGEGVSHRTWVCAVTCRSVRRRGLRWAEVTRGPMPSDCTLSGPLPAAGTARGRVRPIS